MKFGKVDNPEMIDFLLPEDHPRTANVFSKENMIPDIYVGCAKWGKKDLKNFYPRGTKDELAYYATQFNSIELNATFYRMFPPEQFAKWKDKTPEGFKFFPKITQDISHMKRLSNVQQLTNEYIHAVTHLENKLGMVFLQMHQNFTPKDFDKVVKFVETWPKEIPLATEFRHTDWYNNKNISNDLYDLLEQHQITNIIVDSAGRRDLMHMCLTNATAFIRYVGANHTSDYTRLDDWVNKLDLWVKNGLKNIYFFVHQNEEVESPALSAYFINKLNDRIGANIKIPTIP
ncbi:MAG TPA: DUF72 domain-containing protein [Bacteroidales bacterium]|nr:DUF72 domain-containing protein [Bacteroidales bacterium]